jgi:hypothetical protein
MRKTSHAKRVRSIKPMPYEYGHPFFERVREGKRAREETSEEARERGEREREMTGSGGYGGLYARKRDRE